MIKTITTIVLTVIAVLFSMQNFDHVPIYLFWGKAVQIRLIFVLAIAGVGGYLIRHFVGINREERLRRQLFSMKRQNSLARRKKDEFVDDEIV